MMIEVDGGEFMNYRLVRTMIFHDDADDKVRLTFHAEDDRLLGTWSDRDRCALFERLVCATEYLDFSESMH